MGTWCYDVFCGLYGCAYIFRLPACRQFILPEPLVLRVGKTYLRVERQQGKALSAVHITINFSYGTHLRALDLVGKLSHPDIRILRKLLRYFKKKIIMIGCETTIL